MTPATDVSTDRWASVEHSERKPPLGGRQPGLQPDRPGSENRNVALRHDSWNIDPGR